MHGDAASKLSAAHGFRPDALDANRSGTLTPGQARQLGRRGGFDVVLGLAVGALLVAVGIEGLLPSSLLAGLPDYVPQLPTGWPPALVIGGGALVVVWVLRLRRRLSADLAGRRVASVEGTIRKTLRTRTDGDGTTSTTYTYEIAPLRFGVTPAGYDSLDTRLRYRVYYLPRAETVVNIEPVGAP